MHRNWLSKIQKHKILHVAMHGSVQRAKLSYQLRVNKQSYQTVKQSHQPQDHNHPRAEAERETPAGRA